MKISLVTETYFPQVNGVSRALDNLARFMQRSGDAMQLIVPTYDEPVPAEGMEVHQFAGPRLPFYKEIKTPLPPPGAVRARLREFGPDLVHIATEGVLGFTALRAARKLDLPLVSSYHTNFSMYTRSYGLGLLESIIWTYLRWFHNRTSMTFCPSPSIKDILDEKGVHNVRVWRRGVDSVHFHTDKRSEELRDEYGFAPSDVVLVNVGRLANEKNIPMLLDAFAMLEPELPVKLLLVGGGPLADAIEASEDDRIVFAGYRRGDDLARHYASADLMLFPSLTDTFGNVTLEAMASGLPVIGYDAPGPRDIITDGETGFVVHEITPEALADAMRTLVSDPDRLRTMATNARAYAESQTWDAINKVVRDGYLEAVAP